MEEMLMMRPTALDHHRAHHVLGEQQGETVLRRTRPSICSSRIIVSTPDGAEAGVVDQPVERPELLAQSADQCGNGLRSRADRRRESWIAPLPDFAASIAAAELGALCERAIAIT